MAAQRHTIESEAGCASASGVESGRAARPNVHDIGHGAFFHMYLVYMCIYVPACENDK